MKFLKTHKYTVLNNIFKFKFIVLLLIVIFIIPIFNINPIKIRASGVTLTVSEKTQDSVKLNATGLQSQADVIFKVYNATGTPPYNSSRNAVVGFDGTASWPFFALSPGGSYLATVVYEDNPSVVVIATEFMTLSPPTSSVQITKFTVSGQIGSDVIITGENFFDVIDVVFNTASAIPKEVTLGDFIVVTVPPGASTGKITVNTTNNGSATSATDFTVIPAGGGGTSGGNGGTPAPSGNTTNPPPSSNPKIKFNGLVPVCNTGEIDPTTGDYKDEEGNLNNCDFEMVMALVNNAINFVLFILATPLFALILIYVAWLYLSDMGSTENIKKAKKIIKNAFIGYIIALVAWLVVKTILSTLEFGGPMFLS